jgi:hypothetical protein
MGARVKDKATVTMAEPYKSGTWPYKNGTNPRPVPEVIDRSEESEPEPDLDVEPTCAHCSAPSSELRPNGWYRSIRTDERRQAIICKNCGRGCYLPLGVHLERKPKKQVLEEFIVAEDSRPRCPFCSGNSIVRRGVLACGSQRWCCVPCQRRFVSKAFRHATLDRRKVSHWEPDTEPNNAKEEAASLFELALHENAFDEIRCEIGVTELEKSIAEFFTAPGLVSQILRFRDQVMEEFDRLVEEQRRMFFNNLVSGPNSPGNYIQPDTANPMPNPDVANFSVGNDELVLMQPLPPEAAPVGGPNVTGAPLPQGVVPAYLGAGTPSGE